MGFKLDGTRFKSWSDGGSPLSGGLLYSYASGTTTPKATYGDATLGAANTNPVILDARGEADVWLGTGAYTFVLQTAAGVTIDTVDGVVDPQAAADAAIRADLASTASGRGSKLIGFIQRLTGAVARWVEDKLSEEISVKDFGAVGNSSGTTGNGNDDTAAFLAAISACFASSTRPRKLFIPDGWYRVTQSLPIGVANWRIVGESKRVIIYCDHNAVGLDIQSAASQYELENVDIRRVSGKTGTGVQVRAPEGKMKAVKIFSHTTGLDIQDSHLTKMHDVQISGCTTIGMQDNGRCFGSTMSDCNIINNVDGASLKSDWLLSGGAIEQNSGTDLYVSTSADYNGQYFGRVTAVGVHFEVQSGNPTATNDSILVGPSGASIAASRIGFNAFGCWFIGNSSARTAIHIRQCKQASVKGCAFFGYSASGFMLTADAAAFGMRLGGNHWDGTGTYKTINASVVDYIDEDTENDSYNGISMTHLSTGGRLKGIQGIWSAPRAMDLSIISRRNAASTSALNIQTPGTDNATLFTRIAVSSGADIGKVTFPGATVELSGSYTAPTKIGTGYLWTNGGKIWFKDATVPTTATDGSDLTL